MRRRTSSPPATLTLLGVSEHPTPTVFFAFWTLRYRGLGDDRGHHQPEEGASLEDLLIPAIPGLITTMILEAMKPSMGCRRSVWPTGLGVLL
jgi:hypothetical protein